MCCSGLFNYFFSPALDLDVKNWNMDSLENNIVAIPYSTNIKDLKSIQKEVNGYLHQLSKIKHESSVPLLRKLDEITTIQLELSKYPTSTKKTNDLINTLFDETSAQEQLEKLRIKMLNRETAAHSLNATINRAQETFNTCQTTLNLLNSLLDKCRKEHLTKLDQKIQGENVEYSENELWSVDKIRVLSESVPNLNAYHLENLIRAVIRQQSKHQKTMLSLIKELEHYNRVNKALIENINTLKKLEKQLNDQFNDLTLISLEDRSTDSVI